MYQFNFSPGNKIPIYKQIANSVISDIAKGVIEKDFQMPSINKVNKHYSIARDTVERAYKELKKNGYLISSCRCPYLLQGDLL